MMKRGDVMAVAVSRDYGKPRPAVIVQTDALPENHGSVVICQMTSNIELSPFSTSITTIFRVVFAEVTFSKGGICSEGSRKPQF
jgi:mRNA-degrading endonuclease toxin of MazEF toxin-antitoxin module